MEAKLTEKSKIRSKKTHEPKNLSASQMKLLKSRTDAIIARQNKINTALQKRTHTKIKVGSEGSARVSKKEKSDLPKRQTESSVQVSNDSDMDGLDNRFELSVGTDPTRRDSDGDSVSDLVEIGVNKNSPLDSDRDGVIDALDKDDDNDGILTKLEDVDKNGSVENDDTDGDGVPNYQDANDDGDQLSTLAEGGSKDSDKDGVPDYLDKDSVSANSEEDPDLVILYDSSTKPDKQVRAASPTDANNAFKGMLDVVEK